MPNARPPAPDATLLLQRYVLDRLLRLPAADRYAVLADVTGWPADLLAGTARAALRYPDHRIRLDVLTRVLAPLDQFVRHYPMGLGDAAVVMLQLLSDDGCLARAVAALPAADRAMLASAPAVVAALLGHPHAALREAMVTAVLPLTPADAVDATESLEAAAYRLLPAGIPSVLAGLGRGPFAREPAAPPAASGHPKSSGGGVLRRLLRRR